MNRPEPFLGISARANPRFLRVFWLGVGLLAAGATVTIGANAPEAIAAGYVIGAAALLPSYLWVSGRAHGLPIFPLFALTYLWTCATPLIQGNRKVAAYDPADQLVAAGTVVGFLVVGTLVWFGAVQSRPAVPRAHWGFRPDRSGWIFLAFLGAGCLFISPLPWLFLPSIPPGVYSAVRMALWGLSTLSSAILALFWGQRRLSREGKIAFAVLGFLYVFFSTAGLMVHQTAGLVIAIATAYFLGRGRFPVLFLAVSLAVLSLLHLGKWPVRAEYWGDRAKPFPGYVELYTEWLGYGLEEVMRGGGAGSRETGPESVLERGSVVHMVLLVETGTPRRLPYLDGATYALIPQLLVPRALDPDKPWAHEGTYMLSMHYGLQTREQTLKTTIGFGPVAEAYANFGFAGVLGLALVAGGFAGWVARWGMGLPVTSFRALFGFLVLAAFLQTESTAGVIVSSLFQGTVTLILVGLVMMRRVETPSAAAGSLSPAGTVAAR